MQSQTAFYVKQGGQATAFDLAAFRLSMIAPVKKTVNHWRTHVSMRTIAQNHANVPTHAEMRFCQW